MRRKTEIMWYAPLLIMFCFLLFGCSSTWELRPAIQIPVSYKEFEKPLAEVWSSSKNALSKEQPVLDEDTHRIVIRKNLTEDMLEKVAKKKPDFKWERCVATTTISIQPTVEKEVTRVSIGTEISASGHFMESKGIIEKQYLNLIQEALGYPVVDYTALIKSIGKNLEVLLDQKGWLVAKEIRTLTSDKLHIIHNGNIVKSYSGIHKTEEVLDFINEKLGRKVQGVHYKFLAEKGDYRLVKIMIPYLQDKHQLVKGDKIITESRTASGFHLEKLMILLNALGEGTYHLRARIPGE